jgi:hypothetical protein
MMVFADHSVTNALAPTSSIARHQLLPSASLRNRDNESTNQQRKNHENLSRRQCLHQFLIGAGSYSGWTVFCSKSDAACLPGDLSKECIGVYKVPIDDAILPYVGTPEALAKFAPDLKYVDPIQAPPSFSSAIEILETQRIAADDIKEVISAGRLEEAGIKILNLLPKVTSSGKMVVETIERGLDTKNSVVDEIRLTKLRDQFMMLTGLWGECDIEIGQGIRGQMGVSAVAQIQILSSLRDATAEFDDFLATVTSLSKLMNKADL